MNNPTTPDTAPKTPNYRLRRLGAVLGLTAVVGGGVAIGEAVTDNNSHKQGKPAVSASQESTPSTSSSAEVTEGKNEKHLRTEKVDNVALVFSVKEGLAPIHFRTDPSVKNYDPESGNDSGNVAFTVKSGSAAVLIRPVEVTDESGNIWVGGVDTASSDQHLVWVDESQLNHESTSYYTQYGAPKGQPNTVNAIYEPGKGFLAENGNEVVASVYHGIPEDQAFSKYVQPNGFERNS